MITSELISTPSLCIIIIQLDYMFSKTRLLLFWSMNTDREEKNVITKAFHGII